MRRMASVERREQSNMITKPMECPVCKSSEVEEKLGSYTLVKQGTDPNGNSVLQSALRLKVYHCNGCGNVMLYSADGLRRKDTKLPTGYAVTRDGEILG